MQWVRVTKLPMTLRLAATTHLDNGLSRLIPLTKDSWAV